MYIQTKENTSLAAIISIMILIAIVVVFMLQHYTGWEYYVTYKTGTILFWKWFWLIIYITIIYNAFRVYNFVKNTPESQQQRFKKVYFYVASILTITFLLVQPPIIQTINYKS